MERVSLWLREQPGDLRVEKSRSTITTGLLTLGSPSPATGSR